MKVRLRLDRTRYYSLAGVDEEAPRPGNYGRDWNWAAKDGELMRLKRHFLKRSPIHKFDVGPLEDPGAEGREQVVFAHGVYL